MEFEEWINDKFLDWRGNTRKGVTEFSEFIGVSQQTMNGWLNNHVIPKSHKNINQLYEKYGYEVYDTLGLPRPHTPLEEDDVPTEILSDPDFSYVAHQWHKLSPENKQIILQQIKKATNGEITETAQKAVSAVKLL